MIAAMSVVLLLAIVGPFAADGAAQTGLWNACPKADPGLNDCMVQSMEKFIPVLKKGIPQYDVPILDPLVVPFADYSSGDMKLTAKNVKMSKLFTDYKIMLVEAEPDNNKLRINMRIPEILNEGEYEMGGKMLMMPVSGSGTYMLKYKNVSLDVTFLFKPVARDGKTFQDLYDVKVVMTPSGVEVKCENLFNGNKDLSDNFHKFIAENWQEIWSEYKPKVWGAFATMFKTTFHKMFDTLPVSEIYKS